MGRQQSAKDKYERQKELAKLRQRRRKERMTEEEKEAKRKKDRERIARLREEKKVKRINDMTPREQRKMRKYWRERHRQQKIKKQALNNAVSNTPPLSPESSHGLFAQNDESSQKKRGRKQVRRDRAKAYRTIQNQKNRIEELEKKIGKYMKRLQREKKQVTAVPSSPSPSKQLKEIIGKEKVSHNVKKQLFLGLTLKKQVENQLKDTGKKKKKTQVLRKVIGNKIFKKYRVQKYFQNVIPYKTNKSLVRNDQSFDYQRSSKKAIRYKLSEVLTNFFEDDTVSRMCPGKKDVVKKGRVKKQRRILLDTIQNLHAKFQRETNITISRASFYRSRPFWVTFPKMSDRDTCACIKHANMNFLVSALKNRSVIEERTPRNVVQSTICAAEENQNCMMGKCNKCNSKFIKFNCDEDFTVKFYKWVNVKENKVIKNKNRIVKKTVKSVQRKRVSKLKYYLQEELKVFKKHVFYAKHQISELKKLIKNVKPGSLIFRIDFSENYVTKFENEVQSIHFGASKKQMALNTGVRYGSVDGKTQTTSFATTSDNLDHQAHAVWAHMRPIWEDSAKEFPDTEIVHIFSDSPSSQYRNRKNVYLMTTMMPEFFPKLKTVTWNWTEAGHGKGPMDGVGGTLKRGADQKVLHGHDITCAKEFLTAVKDYNVLMFEIPSSDVERLKNVVCDLNISPIKGIMNVHQVTWCNGGQMQTRTLSCFSCPPNMKCNHFHHSEIRLNGGGFGISNKANSKGRPLKKKLSVHDVYTSSSEDDEAPNENIARKASNQDLLTSFTGAKIQAVERNKLVSGTHVVVEYEVKKGKKSQPKQFIGMCQGEEINNEVDVMFLKPAKDNSLYIVNDKDCAAVPVEQIKSIIPTPARIMKGKRVFYKFKNIV